MFDVGRSSLQRHSRLFKNRPQVLQTSTTGFFGSVQIRIKLQTDMAPVSEPHHGFENRFESDGALAGNQVVVFPAWGNVFDVDMAYPLEKLLKRLSGVLSRTKKVAYIKIYANGL